MKIFKTVIIFVLSAGLLLSTSSCVVLVKEDNGKHKGWFKHPDKSNSQLHPVIIKQEKHRGNSGK